MERKGGSYLKDKNGDPVLQERTGAAVTAAQPPPEEPDPEPESEVTDDENT